MLAILEMFDVTTLRITAERVQQQYSLSRATAYRYLKMLTDAGLLARFGSSYVLGSKIIELDHLIRQSDPLLAAGEAILSELSAATDCDTQLLELAGDRLIVASHIRSNAGLAVTYGRGRTTPPMRGAGARVILAMLPAKRQRALVAAARGLAPTELQSAEWHELRRDLTMVRKQGYYISRGELDPERVGIALPIVHNSLDTPAAIVLIMPSARFALADEQRIVALLKGAAGRILRSLEELHADRA